MLGSWPLSEAFVKSVASWLSWVAAVVLPSAWAVAAALVRFVAICAVTCLYSAGFDCWSCWSVVRIWARGESWVLSLCCVDVGAATLPGLLLVSLVVKPAFCRRLRIDRKSTRL